MATERDYPAFHQGPSSHRGPAYQEDEAPLPETLDAASSRHDSDEMHQEFFQVPLDEAEQALKEGLMDCYNG